ncbi:MAG: methionyl-tRNA formyltransferase [Candidatus Yanofskybacteria bacterium]|nr:methionyl-tRNA formyltransferase [Candidatus Yanofskybacteria bacterium]
MPENHLKIVFFGTSDFAVPALKSLLNFGYPIMAVVTQPEKPAGRLRVTMPSPVKKLALENNIPTLEPHNLKNDEEFFKHFKHLNPDLCIVASYGKIIPSRYLEIPKYGFINIHPSLLPKYRGPSPIQTAILNGDTETGVSIMLIDEQMDHGPILGITNYELRITNYYKETEEELAKLGAELLIDTLPKYISGEIKPQEQNHSQATLTKMITREDGHIDWNRPAEEIYNQIRALNPEPGTWTLLRQGSRLAKAYGGARVGGQSKTLNIKTAQTTDSDCGTKPHGLIEKLNNDIAVATKKCYLILKQIQLEGGKEMDAKSFVNGHPDFLSSILE